MKTALMILLLCLAFMTLLAEPNYSDALLQTAQSGDAVAAIRRVRFQPGKTTGQPVDTLVLVPVTFTLQDN